MSVDKFILKEENIRGIVVMVKKGARQYEEDFHVYTDFVAGFMLFSGNRRKVQRADERT